MGPMIMTSEGGNSEFEDYEHLIELNERLTKEVKNLKKLVFEQNERFTKEAKNMKELVVELYHAITMGHAPPPVPSNLSGIAPTIVHQAHGLPTTVEDPQYSPDFPYYNSAAKVAGSSTMCPMAPPPPFAPPSASPPQFTVRVRSESLRNETEKKRDPRKWNKREFKQPLSYSRTPQKHHQQHYSPDNSNYSAPSIHTVQSYAPISSYPQWRAPAPHPIYPIHQVPHNQFQPPPNLPHRPRGPPGFRPKVEYKKVHQVKKNEFTPIGESFAELFQKLQALDILKSINGGMHPRDRVDDSRQCAYHSGAPGHDTEDCHFLKKDIQALIDNGQIQVEVSDAPYINQNSLPVCDDVHMVGMVCGEDLRAKSAMPIVPVGDDSIEANKMLVTMNCLPEVELGVADRVRGGEMKKTNMSLEKPIPNLTRSFISPKEVKSTLMGLGEKEEKKKILPDSGNFFGISMVHPYEGLNNA